MTDDKRPILEVLRDHGIKSDYHWIVTREAPPPGVKPPDNVIAGVRTFSEALERIAKARAAMAANRSSS